MSDNLSTDSVSVAKIAVKLEGPTNYHTWSVLAKAHLKGQGTWGHITGDTPRPVKQADGNNKPESDWLRHDDKAQGAIMNSVDKELLHLIEADMTAKQMWDILATECRQSDMATRMALKRQLHAMRLADAASVNKHIATMGSIRSQLADMGKPVDDEEAAKTLLNSVPDDDTAPQWQMFLRSYTASNQRLTWASVSAAIRAEASQQLQKESRDRPRPGAKQRAAHSGGRIRRQESRQQEADGQERWQATAALLYALQQKRPCGGDVLRPASGAA